KPDGPVPTNTPPQLTKAVTTKMGGSTTQATIKPTTTVRKKGSTTQLTATSAPKKAYGSTTQPTPQPTTGNADGYTIPLPYSSFYNFRQYFKKCFHSCSTAYHETENRWFIRNSTNSKTYDDEGNKSFDNSTNNKTYDDEGNKSFDNSTN
ncbi:Hypothetical predicted protein, partial [Paramuricea clavata]